MNAEERARENGKDVGAALIEEIRNAILAAQREAERETIERCEAAIDARANHTTNEHYLEGIRHAKQAIRSLPSKYGGDEG